MSQASRQGVALLTGASGFVGSNLRDSLLNDGWDVVALVRKGSPEPKQGRAAAVDYADVSSIESVLRAERPEVVFHVAGVTKGVKYADFQQGNVMPTRNLGIALRNAHEKIGRLVHVSSLTAYGPSKHDEPRVETHDRTPVEFYGKSKLEAERVLEDEIGSSVPWTIVRPAGVYGPRDVDNFELFKLAMGRINLFYGNRDKIVSLVHVDDLVRATRNAAKTDATIGKGYFICDGKPVTWAEYQDEIVRATGKRVITVNLPEVTTDLAAMVGELATRFDGKPRLLNRQKAMMGKQVAWTCTHDAAKTDFGYVPQVPLRDGVASTLQWYLSSGWLKG